MQLDHITLVAQSLHQAQAFAAQAFGVTLPAGGRHPLMGTHNLLTRIADTVFLEFIAIDPEAAPPGRPRWFALDRLHAEGRLNAGPMLMTWVASLPGLSQRPPCLPEMETLEVTRDQLRWHFSLPRDGDCLADGVFPSLIDWGATGSPVAKIGDVGLRLEAFHLKHPECASWQARLCDLGWWDEHDANRQVHFHIAEHPSLSLELATPRGRVRIENSLSGPICTPSAAT